mmetsp:Transcript_38656/g.56750  ORF Transcript_38656/g.56750 Transcript_38656/m.56750 type:complete len:209 (-) Transcript_38656:2110-2736(-)
MMRGPSPFICCIIGSKSWGDVCLCLIKISGRKPFCVIHLPFIIRINISVGENTSCTAICCPCSRTYTAFRINIAIPMISSATICVNRCPAIHTKWTITLCAPSYCSRRCAFFAFNRSYMHICVAFSLPPLWMGFIITRSAIFVATLITKSSGPHLFAINTICVKCWWGHFFLCRLLCRKIFYYFPIPQNEFRIRFRVSTFGRLPESII